MKPVLLSILLIVAITASAFAAEKVRFGRFDTVAIYGNVKNPDAVVLFISGDGGWNAGVVEMAEKLAALNSLVAGIDITHYLKSLHAAPEACLYPAADFEGLSKYIQLKYGLAEYKLPILVGYSSGATLVYAILAQSPPNTFAGGISLGFCPDIPLIKPLCKGAGLEEVRMSKVKGFELLPEKTLPTPWVVLHGDIDQVCSPDTALLFASQIPEAEMVRLPKVGHGFSVEAHWMPQFKDAFVKMKKNALVSQGAPAPDKIAGLPLIELPAKTNNPALAVIVTGDGGWAGIDKSLGEALNTEGVSVVALNSLQYFWKKRSPDEIARDLERLLSYYLAQWKKERVLLIGYSLGADVLPFMASRLPAPLSDKVEVIALIGPEHYAEFEFHVTDWLGGPTDKTDYPIRPEVEKLKGKRILCFFGSDEKESLCRTLPKGLAECIEMPGGHHMGNRYGEMAGKILSARKAGKQ